MNLGGIEAGMARLDALYRSVAEKPVGIDPAPVLAEVAAMSSDEDRYGMGSTRAVIASASLA